MIELTVVCSDDERKSTHKFLVSQDGLRLAHDDPELARIVKEAVKTFGTDPLDIVIKLKYTW